MSEGDRYVINGRKMCVVGRASTRAEGLVLMGKRDPSNPDRHSPAIDDLVPREAKDHHQIVRSLRYSASDDAPTARECVRQGRGPIETSDGRGLRGIRDAQGSAGAGSHPP